MKSRALTCLLVITLFVSSFGGYTVFADTEEDMLSGLINKLASYTPEQRKNRIDTLSEMIVMDSGLSALELMIESYDPQTEGMYDALVEDLLAFADKQTLLQMIAYLRIADQNTRATYIDGFRNRVELSLSSVGQASMQRLIDDACIRFEGLKKILDEDGITPGVIAKSLQLFVDLNGGAALLTDGSQQPFAVLYINPELKQKIQSCLDTVPNEKYADADAVFAAVLARLNQRSMGERETWLKNIFSEIGLYSSAQTNPTSSPGGNTGTNPGGTGNSGKPAVSSTPTPSAEPAPDSTVFGYQKVHFDENKGLDIIEICEYSNREKQPFRTLDEAVLVEIAVSDDNAMLYRVQADQLIPVKYSVCQDGKLYCRIDATGEYAVSVPLPYFVDVTGWGRDYIERLYNRGIVNGKEAQLFYPEDSITREEFVKLIVSLFYEADAASGTSFADVSEDAWYYSYICTAQQEGIISGMGDGNFGVGQNITRQDICRLLDNLLLKLGLSPATVNDSVMTFSDSSQIASYAYDSVSRLHSYGVVSGDDRGNFNPEAQATRQEAAKMIYGILELYVKQ